MMTAEQAPSSPMTILVVDDDDRLRDRLSQAFAERGFDVLTAANHSDAIAAARGRTVHRALVDLRMPGGNGLLVIRDLLALHPALVVVVLTGFGSIATAVEAIRLGARDYLTKPAPTDRILAAFETEPGPVPEQLEFETPSLARLEHEHIERVLRECNGNVSKTARVLGMHRRTLQYKLAKFPVSR
ncbi:MAG: response regulator [Myxococcales bacterium]|nr:response regulator [Myxococcales bacterium]